MQLYQLLKIRDEAALANALSSLAVALAGRTSQLLSWGAAGDVDLSQASVGSVTSEESRLFFPIYLVLEIF